MPTPDEIGAMTLREAYETVYPKTRISSPEFIRYRTKTVERLMPKTPVGKIDDEWLATFQKAMADDGLRPSTQRGMIVFVRTLLRYLGPRETGNPRALGVLDVVPYAEVPQVVLDPPKRVKLEEISKTYVACKQMQYPRKLDIPAPDWWRTLIVVAYASGLRKSDLLRISWETIDFAERTLTFTAKKTGKVGIMPLTDWCLSHLQRVKLQHDKGFVFRGWNRTTGRFYQHWARLIGFAGVEHFGPHDIRRTAASEVERVRSGMGAVLLQHRPASVTGMHYLNASEELREAVDKMRVPIGFKAGPKVQQNIEKKQQKEVVHLSPDDFDTTTRPVKRDWKFSEFSFAYKGHWFKLNTARHLVILKLLITSGDPQSRAAIHQALVESGYQCAESNVTTEVSKLRVKLASLLGITNGWDCVPVIRDTNGTCWTVVIPKWLELTNAEKSSGTTKQPRKNQKLETLREWRRKNGRDPDTGRKLPRRDEDGGRSDA